MVREWKWALCVVVAGCLFVGTAAFAEGGSLAGLVTDRGCGDALAGVSVWIKGTRMGAMSDQKGKYEIAEMPAGTYTLVASMVGYTSVRRERVTVESDECLTLNFQLSLRVFEMEEVVVTATRIPRMIKDVPANTSVLTSEDLERTAAKEPDDMLRLTPGIDVDRPMGRVFTAPTVSMRGMGGRSAAGRTLVLLDGVPLNDSYSGDVNWNSLSIVDIERMEIVRGAGSALYGSNAMGGVINVITKGWTQKARTAAKLSYASMNTPTVELHHSAWLGDFGYALTGTYLKTDGYMVTPEEKRKDYDRERTMDSMSLGGKLTWSFAPNASLTLNATHYEEDANAGREYYHGSTTADRLNLTCEGAARRMTWQGTLFANLAESEWTYDTGTLKDKIDYVNTHPKQQLGLSGRSTFELGLSNKLTVGLDYKWGKIESKDEYKQTDRRVEAAGTQQTLGLSAENEFSPNDQLVLTVGARYDRVRTYDGSSLDTDLDAAPRTYEDQTHGHFSPRIGAAYHPEEATTIRASVGRAFQAPSLYSLYRTWKYYATTYQSNPELDPEWLTSFEVGADRTFGDRLLARVTFYRNYASDFIYSILIDADNKIKQTENVGKVTMQGVEAELNVRPIRRVSLSVAYTYNESVIKEFEEDPELEDKVLTYAPKHKVSFGVGYDHPELFTADLIGRYVGERFGDDKNSEKKMGRYFVMDLKLSRHITDYLAVSLGVANLTDKNYEEKSGYVAPGRTITGEITVQR
ncbi:MAG: TonB-dependent receptor [Candidatus Latescibacterota bacterium]